MSVNQSSLWHLYRGAPSEHTEMMQMLDNPPVWCSVLAHGRITEGASQLALNNHTFLVIVNEWVFRLHLTINDK